MLKKRDKDPDADALLVKTTPTIQITGIFADDQTNTQRVRVPIAVHPTDEDTLHLVRPDGYIAFRSCPADLSALTAYLDQAFG